MKISSAVFVAVLAAAPLSAQYWSVGGFGNVAFPALGHAPAGGNPWGNIVTPAMPQGAAAFNRSGGTGLHFSNGAGVGRRRATTSGIYAYPVFVGGSAYADPNQAAPAQPDQPQQPAQPPVVINQYFGTPPADQTPSNFHYYQAPANDDAAPPADSSYYLIAFKDHTVYSAVAYYTEGDTLHYFTSGNVHNQASLSLVDRQLTEQLNRAHNVEVRLPE